MKRPVWEVQWCGSPCAGNPHKTKKAAQSWITNIRAEAKAAKAIMYGDYRIVRMPALPTRSTK